MASRGLPLLAARDAELPRMVGLMVAVWQLTVLVEVLAYMHDYRQPAVTVAVWLGLLAAAAWLVPRARAGRFTGADAAVAVGTAVAAVALVGWERVAPGSVDWSVVGSGWLLALVALSRRAWEWVLGALLVFAVHTVMAIHLLGVNALSMARLAATAYTLVVILVVFAALQPTWRTNAGMAARRAALTSRLAAEQAAKAAVHADRRERLALLEVEALPLLRGVADGDLDPADGAVREQCARHAATLRRALADRPQDAGGLLAELEPALRAARARGMPAEVQVVGDPGRPAPEVAGATLAAVDAVLTAIPPHPVLLTVLASGDDVELYVTFDRAPGAAPDVTAMRAGLPATARWAAVLDIDDAGSGCLEVRWRKAVPG